MKQVTNGELQTFKGCKRKWWLGWFRHLRPKAPEVTGAAPLGTRVHKALQAYYTLNSSNPYEVLAQSIQEDADRLSGDIDAIADLRKEGELAQLMLEGYFQWLGEEGADQGLIIIAAEQRLEVPFPAIPDVNLMGKLDVRVQRETDGARLFLDHKTVGSFPDAMKGLAMNEQMLHYHLLEYLDFLKQDGASEVPTNEIPLTDGGLYNMLRKVKRTARANPPFYMRVEVRHNRNELQSYYLRVYGEVLEIMRLEQLLRDGNDPRMVAFPTPHRDCSWKCEFYGVCPIFDDNPVAAEAMLADWFEERDPLDRYEVDTEPTA